MRPLAGTTHVRRRCVQWYVVFRRGDACGHRPSSVKPRKPSSPAGASARLLTREVKARHNSQMEPDVLTHETGKPALEALDDL